ncbi:2TM domain-containing protein [Maribacter sp. 4G9]|uniref:2TM domain-containing protein n=1 Tax=Maribacter sp. 4G9 TaxID=1889777 RepID=UPI000C1514D0|nr:2TM domain-containing protein [Maribacter sp. 4G9]PIB39504.1 histidine kinase [Maribacter sp. 4G9]
MTHNNQESKYYRAKERVENIRKFYTSFLSYILFIAFLGGLNYWLDEWRYPWFLWAAFGWGIGLIFQAVKAFGFIPILGKDWEERKINELMREDEEQTKWK